MKAVDFVKATIGDLNPSLLADLKQELQEVISFSVLNLESVTIDEYAEKLCDYFEALGLHYRDDFDRYIDGFMHDLDDLVGLFIAKTPQPKKGEKTPVVVPRARKYYEKAIKLARQKKHAFENVLDYARIMFCLYNAVIESKHEVVENFNYAADCLKPHKIMEALKDEEAMSLLPGAKKKKRFDTKKRYSLEVSTLVLSALVLESIANQVVEGDSDHE